MFHLTYLIKNNEMFSCPFLKEAAQSPCLVCMSKESFGKILHVLCSQAAPPCSIIHKCFDNLAEFCFPTLYSSALFFMTKKLLRILRALFVPPLALLLMQLGNNYKGSKHSRKNWKEDLGISPVKRLARERFADRLARMTSYCEGNSALEEHATGAIDFGYWKYSRTHKFAYCINLKVTSKYIYKIF